ncbi:MAG: hypothetical protein ACRCW3_01015 [Metamycoplasmataceae bacterium]
MLVSFVVVIPRTIVGLAQERTTTAVGAFQWAIAKALHGRRKIKTCLKIFKTYNSEFNTF